MKLRYLLLVVLLGIVAMGVGHAQALQNITVHIQNPTSGTLNYSYKIGGDDWSKKTIRSGYTITYRGIAPHGIRYHNGQKVVFYTLKTSKTYYFAWRNGVLNLFHR